MSSQPLSFSIVDVFRYQSKFRDNFFDSKRYHRTSRQANRAKLQSCSVNRDLYFHMIEQLSSKMILAFCPEAYQIGAISAVIPSIFAFWR